jgi:hypothetical protein
MNDNKQPEELEMTKEDWNDIANGREAECCVDCGVPYLTDKQKREGNVTTFHNGQCCVCGEEKQVTSARHYNYLNHNFKGITEAIEIPKS